jgi:hypothetical protein
MLKEDFIRLQNRLRPVGISLFLAMLAAVTVFASIKFHEHDAMGKREDIYYSWLEGNRILSNENPYERVLSGDMWENDKYATYFPLFYLLSALTQLVGLSEPEAWICFWRYVFLCFHLGAAALIFLAVFRGRGVLLALFAASFWLLNRWSLLVLRIAHIDIMALFFLLLSLLLLEKHKWASFLLLGVSLAIKQIAIFVAPLYLIWAWNAVEKNRVREVVIAAVGIAIIPLVFSLPFIVWNAEGFFKSVLFSVTRKPEGHFAAPSIDQALGLVGIVGRVPMLGLMGLIYYEAGLRRIGKYASVLLVMCVFTFFTPVLFRQYMCWIVPFIPLCLCDGRQGNQACEGLAIGRGRASPRERPANPGRGIERGPKPAPSTGPSAGAA